MVHKSLHWALKKYRECGCPLRAWCSGTVRNLVSSGRIWVPESQCGAWPSNKRGHLFYCSKRTKGLGISMEVQRSSSEKKKQIVQQNVDCPQGEKSALGNHIRMEPLGKDEEICPELYCDTCGCRETVLLYLMSVFWRADSCTRFQAAPSARRQRPCTTVLLSAPHPLHKRIPPHKNPMRLLQFLPHLTGKETEP